MSLILVLRTEVDGAVEAAVAEGRPIDKAALIEHFARHFELFGISRDQIVSEVERAVAAAQQPPQT